MTPKSTTASFAEIRRCRFVATKALPSLFPTKGAATLAWESAPRSNAGPTQARRSVEETGVDRRHATNSTNFSGELVPYITKLYRSCLGFIFERQESPAVLATASCERSAIGRAVLLLGRPLLFRLPRLLDIEHRRAAETTMVSCRSPMRTFFKYGLHPRPAGHSRTPGSWLIEVIQRDSPRPMTQRIRLREGLDQSIRPTSGRRHRYLALSAGEAAVSSSAVQQ